VHSPRPKNLNLFTIHFPIPAIVSILHRITGVGLFLLIPFTLWLLSFSLTNQGFIALQSWSGLFWIKIIFWLALVPFFFHLVAGIRHLLMDIHIGDTLQLGRIVAWTVFVATFVLILLAGIWLW
jgi:succinate dehydrogenase / fumarate reductase, cytochrome b subunit